jgi:thioredoxin
VGKLPEISDETFEAEVVQADKPVLVDFWAPWCAPCRMVSSVLEQVAEERGDALKIVKLNIDEHQENAAKLGIMLLPTLLLYKDGKPIDKMQGSMPPRAIAAMLDAHLGEPVAS